MNTEQTATQEEAMERDIYFQRYHVRLEGLTPLLMHKDELSFSEAYVKPWQQDPANKKYSVSGDDRSPAWTYTGYMYADAVGEKGASVLSIPADNLMTLLREGGAKVPPPASVKVSEKTLKKYTQSGIMVDQVAWPLLVKGVQVPFASFQRLVGNNDFSAHEALAKKHGFELFAKRARVGQAKHVRVRPRFEPGWEVEGTLTVLDAIISTEVLQDIVNQAGHYCGLGDWRPSSPKSPGLHGRFKATVTAI